MLERIEFKGYWWLPEDPDTQVPGTLTFSQEEGSLLELVGTYGANDNHRTSDQDVILGISQDGKAITLHRCQPKNWNYSALGFGGVNYYVGFIFEGAHFEKDSDIKFHQLCGNYTDLDAWVDTFGFSIDWERQEDQPVKVKIDFSKPANQFVKINDEFEAGIGFSSHGPSVSRTQTEVKIIQRAYLVVKSLKGDIPFHELFTLLDNFSDLQQIAVQRISYQTKIFGLTEANREDREGGRPPYYPEVNIYFHPIEPFVERKQIFPHEMLFTFKDLDSEQIQQWFSHYDRHKTEIKLHRTLFYSNRLFRETRFLNIAQALETLHTILFDNFYLSQDEFLARRDIAASAAPEELREWVVGALSNANYKSFKLKIVELLNNKAALFARVISDIDQFAKRVRDTRNEYVHHSEKRWTFRDTEEMVSAIYLLTYLFEAYMLEMIDFAPEKIEQIYQIRLNKYLSRWKKF